MADLIIIAVLLLLIVPATVYIIKAKKKGRKCIGCPSDCSSCTGNCSQFPD